MTGPSSTAPPDVQTPAGVVSHYDIDIEALGRNNLRRLLPCRPTRSGVRADPAGPVTAVDTASEPRRSAGARFTVPT